MPIVIAECIVPCSMDFGRSLITLERMGLCNDDTSLAQSVVSQPFDKDACCELVSFFLIVGCSTLRISKENLSMDV